MVGNPEVSMEIDPREVEQRYIQGIAAMVVDRLSMGVQDTNQEV